MSGFTSGLLLRVLALDAKSYTINIFGLLLYLALSHHWGCLLGDGLLRRSPLLIASLGVLLNLYVQASLADRFTWCHPRRPLLAIVPAFT